MINQSVPKRVEILSKEELARTLARLASQILEEIPDRGRLLLLGIPTRGIQLAEVLANELHEKTGQSIEQGVIDPTFHRDDLNNLGTKFVPTTDISSSLEGKHVVRLKSL